MCKYLHQKEDYLEMCYGYSRGVEITSDRESMGREREEREIDFFFFFMEFNVSWSLGMVGSKQGRKEGNAEYYSKRKEHVQMCSNGKRCTVNGR